MGLLYRVSHPYSTLTPEVVLDACASLGQRPDGRLLGLNSYENRVYQVWLEDNSSVVLKFYRPGAGPGRRSTRSTPSRASSPSARSR
jgi:Ser/Thr protein kinase RdoA (MazF antagonist)